MTLNLPQVVRGCLFDMDGVLTQTATVHEAAWKELFDSYLEKKEGPGYSPFTEADYANYVDGRARADGTRAFLESRGISLPEGSPDDPPSAETVQGLSNRKNQILLQKLQDDGVKVFDDAVAFVKAVKEAGLPRAVVSASANTAQVLDSAGIAELFDARIDGLVAEEEHLAGKPAPDMYLAGAKALGLDASACAVFEDALAGVEAGRAGRFAFVVGVDRVGHAEALKAHGADVAVNDLTALIGEGPAGQ